MVYLYVILDLCTSTDISLALLMPNTTVSCSDNNDNNNDDNHYSASKIKHKREQSKLNLLSMIAFIAENSSLMIKNNTSFYLLQGCPEWKSNNIVKFLSYFPNMKSSKDPSMPQYNELLLMEEFKG